MEFRITCWNEIVSPFMLKEYIRIIMGTAYQKFPFATDLTPRKWLDMVPTPGILIATQINWGSSRPHLNCCSVAGR